MNSITKKIFAALSAGTLLMSAVSCDSDDSDSSDSSSNLVENAADNINMGEAELPYGATITQVLPKNDDSILIGIEYDNRFVTLDEAKALSNYVASINNCDGELLEKTFYKPRLDYILENQGEPDASKYLETIHENIADNYINDEFDFNYVLIEDCFDESYDDSKTGFSSIDNFIAEKSGQETVDKITSRKLVQYDIQYTPESEPGSAYVFSRRSGTSSRMYIYTIDGVCYIL